MAAIAKLAQPRSDVPSGAFGGVPILFARGRSIGSERPDRRHSSQQPHDNDDRWRAEDNSVHRSSKERSGACLVTEGRSNSIRSRNFLSDGPIPTTWVG